MDKEALKLQLELLLLGLEAPDAVAFQKTWVRREPSILAVREMISLIDAIPNPKTSTTVIGLWDDGNIVVAPSGSTNPYIAMDEVAANNGSDPRLRILCAIEGDPLIYTAEGATAPRVAP